MAASFAIKQDVRRVADGKNRASVRVEWITSAQCRKGDPDALFVTGAAQRRAKLICQRCPVMMQCRVDALDNKVEFGVWGGLTERERRALLRNNPDITSWAEFYTNGQDHLGNS